MASTAERMAVAASRRKEVCLEIARRAKDAAGATGGCETRMKRKEGSIGRRFRAMDALLRCAEAVEAAADAARAEKDASLASRSFLASHDGDMTDLVAVQVAAKEAEDASTRASEAVSDGLATRAAASAANRARKSADQTVSEALRRCNGIDEVLEVAHAAKLNHAEDARRLAARAYAEADACSCSRSFPPPYRATDAGEEEVEEALEKALETLRERCERAAEFVAAFVLGAFPPETTMKQQDVDVGTEETELALSRVEYAKVFCEKIRDSLRTAWEKLEAMHDNGDSARWARRAEILRHNDAIISSIVAPNSTYSTLLQAAKDEDGGWILANGCGTQLPWVGLSTVMHRPPWMDAWMDAEQEIAIEEVSIDVQDVDTIGQSLWANILHAVSCASVLQQPAARRNFVHSVVGSVMDSIRSAASKGDSLFAAEVLCCCAQVIIQAEDEPFFLELEETSDSVGESDGSFAGAGSPSDGTRIVGEGITGKTGFVLQDIVDLAMEEARQCADAVGGEIASRFRKQAKAYARKAGLRLAAAAGVGDAPDADLLRALYQLDEDLSKISQKTDQMSYLHIWKFLAGCVEEFLREKVLASAKTISKQGILAFAADVEAATAAMSNTAPRREHSGIRLSVRWRSLQEAISISERFYCDEDKADGSQNISSNGSGTSLDVANLKWLSAQEGDHLLAALSRGTKVAVS